VRTPIHTSRSIELQERFESMELRLGEETKRFFKLFEKSTFEGSQAAAREMAIDQAQAEVSVVHGLHFLVRFSDSEMLSWPNSPLLVLLQFVNPNILSGNEDAPLQATPLHHLADLADHSDNSTHVNQLILARHLIEYGVNVNTVSIPHGRTPLHHACHGNNMTNLDFVELL
jgi:hypothetical protein